MPYDGPVDVKLQISVDRAAATKQQAEATRARGLIRQELMKLKHARRALIFSLFCLLSAPKSMGFRGFRAWN